MVSGRNPELSRLFCWGTMRGLNKQQEDFIQGIMRGLSQRQAYYDAYPHSLKWKPNNVDAKASALFNSDKVQARYKVLQEQAAEANGITRDAILTELKRVGFSNVDADRIKPADKLRALELLARIMGLDSPEY